MKLARRTFLHLATGSAAFATVARSAIGQSYPTRPITLVVPFAPGGTTDALSRMIAERMKGVLGQSLITENVGGANGTIGVGRVARAAPDGYTLGLGLWSTHVINGAVYSLRYDLQSDFAPVGLIAAGQIAIYVKNTFPANSLHELIAWLKANPDKASQGVTTAGAHALGWLFQRETGTRYQFVPYRGAGPAIQDLIAGHIDLVIDSLIHLPHVQAGTIKIHAVFSDTRANVAPDLPTTSEQGFPALSVTPWFGLFAPKGTPKDIVSKINLALLEALDDPQIRARLRDMGFGLFPREELTPEALERRMKSDIEKWWPIVKAANIKGD